MTSPRWQSIADIFGGEPGIAFNMPGPLYLYRDAEDDMEPVSFRQFNDLANDNRIISGILGVSSRADLRAVDTEKSTKAFLEEAGREGFFLWRSGDYSTQIAADTLEGLYVKADAIASTAGAWVRVFDRDVVVTWFGAKLDGVTADHAAIQAAFTIAGSGKCIRFPRGTCSINGVIQPASSNISVHFDGTDFLVGHTGTGGVLTNTGTAKMAFLFKNLSNISITGTASFKGITAVGSGIVSAVNFDTCSRFSVPAYLAFENVPLGAYFHNCTNGLVGDMQGKDIDGLQAFAEPPSGTGGSVQVFSGSKDITLGGVLADNIDKPARYLSTATGAGNNERIHCGPTIIKGKSGSTETHGVAIRSALDCTFGPVITDGNTRHGVMVISYTGDYAAGYRIDRVLFESINGVSVNSGASLDSVFSCESEDGSAIGKVTVGSIDASCAGEAGIFVSAGTVHIGAMKLTGAATSMVIVAAVNGSVKPRLTFGTMEIDAPTGANSPVIVGKGGYLAGDLITFPNDHGGAGGMPAVRYHSSYGTGHTVHYGVRVKTIEIGASSNFNLATYDDTHSRADWTVTDIIGAGSLGGLHIQGDNYQVRGGDFYLAGSPTAGASKRGDVVYEIAPSAGGSPGRVCTTAGTPGTWKAMANVAA